VVIAYGQEESKVFVITAYEPSAALWKDDFKTRK
jgi:hypothetical protein